MWCIAQFSEVLGGKGEVLLDLFKISCQFLEKENYLPVRLTAAKSLRVFAHKIERSIAKSLDAETIESYRLNDPENMKNLLDLLEKSSEETVHIILEGILILCRVYFFK